MKFWDAMFTPVRWASYHLGQAFHVSSQSANSIFGVQPTSSGVNITERNALQLSAVWAAVRLISETIACLPLHLYRRKDDDDARERVKAKDHPVAKMLARRPNSAMSWFTWKEITQGHLLTHGRGSAEIERDRAGRPIGLWPITPDRIQVDIDKNDMPYYRVDGKDNLHPDDVLFVPGFGFDGLSGYAPIGMARESLGLASAQEKYGASFFASGGKPTGLMKHKKRLSPEARKANREEWQQIYGGAGNPNRIVILQEGTEYQSISLPPEDSQFLQSRQFSVTEIARWFRVPPHMIGDLVRSTNNNIEQQAREFLTYSILPWLERWTQELSYKLLEEKEQEKYFFAFSVDKLLMADIATRYKAYATGRQWGWFSVNDVRRLEDMAPIDGGDEYLTPTNMTSADEVGKEDKNSGGLIAANGMPIRKWLRLQEASEKKFVRTHLGMAA